MVTTDPQLLEMLKLAAWQQAVIGLQAAWSIRQALRLDDTPSPPIPADEVLARLVDVAVEIPQRSEAQEARDLVDKPAMNRRVHDVWAGTQLLLSAAANVSKLLWPPPRDSDLHCEDLRLLLGVDETWALKNRELRDGFEHFGQRIVDWIPEHAGEPFSDSRIVRSSDAMEDGAPQPLRTFLEDTFSVSLLGRSFALKPLEDELDAIRSAASPDAGLYLEA